MNAPTPHGTIDLGDGSWVRHEPGWLCTPEADAAWSALRKGLQWEQREIVIFGRRIAQPRLIAWAGALPYRYSGQTLEPRPAPGMLADLLDRVNEACDGSFNHVLANLYRNGRDSMGMHADDEPELGPSPLVASLSLGVTRRFVFATRRVKGPSKGARPANPDSRSQRRQIALAHGTLLVMGGAFQHHHRHGLPKQARIEPLPGCGPERISLTFRRVLHPPKAAATRAGSSDGSK
jgi:alkylated DNA repair dioxygenase AlkB